MCLLFLMYCSVSEQDIANMKDSWFFDNNFNGLSDDIFDDVVGFFDFPLEEVEDDWDSQFKCLEDQHSEVFSASSNGLCAKPQTENPQFGTEFSVSVSILSTVMVCRNVDCDIFNLLNFLLQTFFETIIVHTLLVMYMESHAEPSLHCTYI